MKCDVATEFVSAYCDGEGIPEAVAHHIAECEGCSARLKEYEDIGQALRRMASLETTKAANDGEWAKVHGNRSIWWMKGRQTMRIPRFVFVSLLALIAALGSTLVIVRARAQLQRGVLMLTAKPASGETVRCSLSIEDKNASSCASVAPGQHIYAFRIISRDGDRIELGVRTHFVTVGTDHFADKGSVQEIDNLPETRYWFQPGEKLDIDVPGSGVMVVTGDLMDHMPTLFFDSEAQLEPRSGELRIISPVLIVDKKIVYDFEGINVIVNREGSGIQIYVPGDGRYELSLSPLEGAVEGRSERNRLSFDLNGRAYGFLMAAPITKSERVWVLHDPSYKPPDGALDEGFIGPVELTNQIP